MTKIEINCPTCNKACKWGIENHNRPFCSDRCKLIDLGEWASESRKIPCQPFDPLSDILEQDI